MEATAPDDDSVTDADLISASLSDPAVLAGIFDRHAATLLAYLVRRVGPSEAESLLGELFRIAFEHRFRYDLTRDAAVPWLYGIAANLVLRHQRSAGRQRRALTRLAGRGGVEHSASFEDRLAEQDANLQLLADVRAVIDDLPDRDREVVLLHVWERLSYADIADALQIPIGTVRSRLHRVRTALRELRAATEHQPDALPRAQRGTI